MKVFKKFAFLILLPSLVYAQQGDPYLESLHKSLAEASNDTTRMDAFRNLGDYYLLANHDSARFYFAKALPLATGLNLKLNEASILNSFGLLLMYDEKYAQSFQTFLRAVKIARDRKSEERTWHLQPGQDAASERLSVLGYTYDFIGLLNAFAGNWTENIENQLKNYREAKRLAIEAHDKDLMPLPILHMGIAHMNAGKLDSALDLVRQAVSMFSDQKNYWYVGASMKYLGEIYEKMGNLDSARYMELQAIRLLEQTSDYAHKGRAYLSLSRIYMDIKSADSALYFGRKALYLFENIKDPEGRREAYNLLSSHFDRLHYADSATVYLKLAKSVSDSLSNEQRKNLLAFQDVVVDEQIRLETLEKEKIETRDKQRIFLLVAAIAVFIIVAFLLYRNSRQRRKANEVLQQRNKKIENTLNQLRSTQQQLVQSEKMASLGELTAGIAHEIQNPLNFVNNFSDVNTELVDELKSQLAVGNMQSAIEIANDIKDNEQKINHHGKRADSIVKGMLQHSRTSSGNKELTDINALCDEYLRLAYHGLRAKDKSLPTGQSGFNAEIKTDFDSSIGKINIVPQDIGRVMLNLVNNAFYAVSAKAIATGDGNYKPVVAVGTRKINDKAEIAVRDNGNGIPKIIVDKIFQPFFTTKPTGQGTGLGLSLAYDIVKAHGGEIKVESKEGEGSEFVILLPIT